ncbi:hypothetical protein K491DRAFT_685070 [Lophiostoma macrostomum CBS 122681]|uniref:Uncharacterized protein n=1 Tax=Lophiostoma macrostomum CBS 122681 TaxID=1314788 RepID=A0A6A6SLW8_9PLEO|nr:hypothetical protein K491DRAFT_685070 [Lophiostoma macrostomum CBS 122681]
MDINLFEIATTLDILIRLDIEEYLTKKLVPVYSLLKSICGGRIIIPQQELVERTSATDLHTVIEGVTLAISITIVNNQLAEELNTIDKAVAVICSSLRHRVFTNDMMAKEMNELESAIHKLSATDIALGKVFSELHDIRPASEQHPACSILPHTIDLGPVMTDCLELVTRFWIGGSV